jgi:hypothetical protein
MYTWFVHICLIGRYFVGGTDRVNSVSSQKTFQNWGGKRFCGHRRAMMIVFVSQDFATGSASILGNVNTRDHCPSAAPSDSRPSPAATFIYAKPCLVPFGPLSCLIRPLNL